MSITDASDEKQIDEAVQKKAKAEAQKRADIKAIIDMPEGRRFLKRFLLNECHLFDNGFCSSGSLTYFNLGSLNVGYAIKQMLDEINPGLFAQILQEELKDE